MPVVIGIRFRDSGKVYYFDPGGLDLHAGDLVIVETVRGLEIGKVAQEAQDVAEEEIIGELKRVIRRPSRTDLERMLQFSARQQEVLAICAERVAAHNLPMRLIKAEYNFDGSRLTFYFTADQRIDFRALVRDLARTFRTRIELRQVGPRDEARLLGGIGPCGRPLCCATFLPDFARVSIKMAKDQDLPLNPSKISGVCGRLLCCLSYEHEQYLEIKAELPPRGAWVQTPHGPGEVIAVNIVRETVTVDVGGNSVDCTADQIAEATALVSGEARARVEAGTAAPVTREIYLQPDDELELDEDDLALLEASESGERVLDIAEERLPYSQRGRQMQQRPNQQEDERDRQRQGRRAQPVKPAGSPRSAAASQPHALSTEDLQFSDLPELHQVAMSDPEQQLQRKHRRRRRRKKGSGGQAGQAAAQTVKQEHDPAPGHRNGPRKDRKLRPERPPLPRSEETPDAGREHPRRVPRRRRR